jgi:serine/threonine protein kinase
MGNARFKDRFQRNKQHLLTENLIVTKNMNVRDVYDVVEEIGKGSVSTIYKIRKRDDDQPHPEIRRKNLEADGTFHPSCNGPRSASDGPPHHGFYALKQVNLDNINPNNHYDFFQNEVEILRRLDHPNIVRAFEAFSYKSNDDGRSMTGIVFELCEGGDLYSRAPYTEQQAGAILYKLVKVVHYMHLRRVMHLDVKMKNIMFESTEPDAEIKLIDFGLSIRRTKCFRHENFDLLRGTIFYLAPEVLMGHYDYHADMWSIGVVAFVLLSGEKPFRAKNRQVSPCFVTPFWNEQNMI